MSSKRSRVHPNHKTKYRVGNWPAYDRSLIRGSDLAPWLSPDPTKHWNDRQLLRHHQVHRPHNDERFHQALDNELIGKAMMPVEGQDVHAEQLDGLLKIYRRAA